MKVLPFPRSAPLSALLAGLLASLAACGVRDVNGPATFASNGTKASPGKSDGTRLRPWTPKADNVVLGARYVPDSLDGAATYGVDSGGGVRALVGGVRVLALGEGALVPSAERFAVAPTRVFPLPARLGGGFVFQVGSEVRRSESWLGQTMVLHKGTQSYIGAAPTAIQAAWVGFDRLYVRDAASVVTALDPKTGAPTDLGTWPRAPSIGTGSVAGFAAVDGWRGVALAAPLGFTRNDLWELSRLRARVRGEA